MVLGLPFKALSLSITKAGLDNIEILRSNFRDLAILRKLASKLKLIV